MLELSRTLGCSSSAQDFISQLELDSVYHSSGKRLGAELIEDSLCTRLKLSTWTNLIEKLFICLNFCLSHIGNPKTHQAFLVL